MAKKEFAKMPGCLYQRSGGRWYWKVILPGETNFSMFALKPRGGRFATKDPGVAEQLAQEIWAKIRCEMAQNETKTIPYDGTITGLVERYLPFAKKYYRHPDGRSTGEAESVEWALQTLLEKYPALPAEDFSPLKLIEIQGLLIKRKLCRNVINKIVGIIKRAFKWAASQELIPSSVYHGLQTVNLTEEQRPRLAQLLEVNQTLASVYILKDQLKMLYYWDDRIKAKQTLDDWCAMAGQIDHPAITIFIKRLRFFEYGILNHADYPIGTSMLEGINNKIKVIKRKAYGFHDDRYFILKVKQACAA